MYAVLGQCVTRYWPLMILGWIALAVGLQFGAPAWDAVTLDGDFAYLPDKMGSVQADKFLDKAYPGDRPKSQIVVVVARGNKVLTDEDKAVADEVAVPFLNALAAAQITRAQALVSEIAQFQPAAGDADGQAKLQSLREQHDRAIDKSLVALDQLLTGNQERNGPALHNRSLAHRLNAPKLLAEGEAAAAKAKTEEDREAALTKAKTEHDEALTKANADHEAAIAIDPGLKEAGDRTMPPGDATLPLVDVWTQHTEVAGRRLRSKDGRAVLIVIQMSTEFMATRNIGVLEWVNGKLEKQRYALPDREATDLQIRVTGSAAVGADMLDSANKDLHSTELLTTVLVIAILLVVYRAPLLVAVPLLTIAVSYLVATSTVAALTQVNQIPLFEPWWTFKVFKTTRIFIVVILYGCGTDFCLFLIARYKEELIAGKDRATAMIESVHNIGDAVTASACTTIFGLSMMFFAEYGKFSNSGPAIAVCLAVTLVCCLTFAPALLYALGDIVFWSPFTSIRPGPAAPQPVAELASATSAKGIDEPEEDAALGSWWQWTADVILARPVFIMVATLAVMLPMAWFGMGRDVSYDFLHELSPQRTAVIGIELLQAHFPVGESGPVTILAHRPGANFDEPAGMGEIQKLTEELWTVPGVQSVRSLSEPLGDKPKPFSILSAAGRDKIFIRKHRLTREIYLARDPKLKSDVTRLDLLLGPAKDDPAGESYDPFAPKAREILKQIVAKLEDQKKQEGWENTTFYVAGTTASIRDLAEVTERDTRNIQIYVVAAVFLVLIFILRQFWVSVYMMASVLVSYYFTMGVTIILFPLIYGATYTGMDWKVPLFLFVILVAIGQDYNIYLVTRVFEETPLLGPREGLRAAIRTTGAIITSCGVIMAGSFVSMTIGSLRAISELGFTLTFGILLDTFVVRTLLLPSFMALGLTDEKPKGHEPLSPVAAIPEAAPSGGNGAPHAEESHERVRSD